MPSGIFASCQDLIRSQAESVSSKVKAAISRTGFGHVSEFGLEKQLQVFCLLPEDTGPNPEHAQDSLG